MRKSTISITVILILCVSLLSIGCSKGQQKPSPETEKEPKPVPSVVEEIEGAIISIMSQVDLIPYYEKQIAEKEKKKQEKIQLQILTGQSQQQGSEEKKQKENQGSQEQGGKNELDKLIEFKPSPITINDILLSEIIKKEKKEDKEEKKDMEIPEDIIEIWHEINTQIMDLHDKWNTLETEISKSNSPNETIIEFEDTLNKLTIASTNKDYMNTLIYSNKLTSYIPSLITNFKNKFPNSIYHMKYHIRQIVLACGNNDYTMAKENLDKIKIYLESLTPQLIEKKLTEQAGKLKSSLTDLEDAIKLQDINIIKIKASILMKNMNSIKEELSK